jgi:hypothetical protein
VIVKALMAMEPKKKQHKEELLELQRYFILQQKPNKFNPYDEDNILAQMERNFEDTCAVMQENGIANPKALTEFEFYSRLTYYEKKYNESKR